MSELIKVEVTMADGDKLTARMRTTMVRLLEMYDPFATPWPGLRWV
jgi:hypothetical protein